MRLITLLLVMLPLSAIAQDTAVRAPNGQLFDYCITCHGTEGRGNRSVNAPRLSGLSAWYIENQLNAFREGWRGAHPDDYHGGEMRPMAVALVGEAQVKAAAEYFAAFPAPETVVTVRGNARRGEALYATCIACHGARGEGNEAMASPRLAGQNDWYIERQLNHFRTGIRGSAPRDARGAQMAAMSRMLTSEEQVKDVVAYINSFTTDVTDDHRVQQNLIGSDFPIARAVEVPGAFQLVYHSGLTPRPANPEAEQFSAEYWGDTKAQAFTVFERMEASLADLGVSLDDIVHMTVFLVPDPATGRMDFSGFMAAYTQYFGDRAGRLNLPARSAVGVAQLARPGMLVEIEAVYSRPE